jgi:FADH2 O2-dependent halogenase
VPDLAHTDSYLNVIDNIGPGSGMKRSIGYVYHRDRQEQKPDEIFQKEMPETLDGPKINCFREEIDEYLAKIAIK